MLDDADDLYFVLILDKPGNLDGGEAWIEVPGPVTPAHTDLVRDLLPPTPSLITQVNSQQLKNGAAGVLQCDDENECKHPGWDNAAGAGEFHWDWNRDFMDGMVFGPLPPRDACFHMRALKFDGLDTFAVGGYDSDLGDMSMTPLTAAQFAVGVTVCGHTCENFCESFTNCGTCTDNQVRANPPPFPTLCRTA